MSTEKGSMEEMSKKWKIIRSFELVLRILCLVLTLIGAVIGGVDKDTQTISISLVDSMPPLRIPVTAKWNYMSSTVYFVVANAIACAYSAASLLLFMLSHSNKTRAVLAISDLLMVALLFSANGAMAAVGLIALKGNSHAQWHQVCNIFETYCHRASASFAMSMLGSIIFLWLVVLATLDLHKRTAN